MHIVIVSHYYPPLNAIASLRPLSFAKYFVENGIDVTILTTQKSPTEGYLDLQGFDHPKLKVVEVPYSSLKFWKRRADVTMSVTENTASGKQGAAQSAGMLTRMRKAVVAQLGSLVDYQLFWVGVGLKKINQIHQESPIDVIISTYSPPAAHRIAGKMKARFPKIQWIADYRDLWSLNHVMAAGGLLRYIERFVEKRTMRNVNYLTTVSQPLADDLQKLTENQVPVSVIFNGYQGLPEKSAIAIEKKDKLPIKIVYTGTIYPGRRDPSPLMLALNELEQEGVVKKGEVVVEFYGTHSSNLEHILKNCQGHPWSRICGYVSHQKSLEIQQSADFLLFLESGAPDARGVLTGKLFEYIITGKPILALGVNEESASSQVIMETGTGVVLGEDKDVIKGFFKDYLSANPQYLYQPNWKIIHSYSRDEQAYKLLEIAKSLLG